MREGPRRWLLLALLVAGQMAHAAIELTDDRGERVTLQRPPQRIVSLLPSLTETVCALGQCQRLVGLDRYSNHPASVRALPRVGGGLDPSIEAIVALKPDLVLLATSSRAALRLQSLGLTVAAFEPRSHAGVLRVLEQVGRLLGVPPEAGAQRVWREIEAGMQAAAQSLPAAARGTRVYVEVNSGPYAASEQSFIGETLARLGARNIVPGELGPFPKLNPEFVVRADPDLIMVGDSSAAAMVLRPGWAGLRAIRAQRICAYTPQQSDVLVRAGPRMAEGARLMAACLSGQGVPP